MKKDKVIRKNVIKIYHDDKFVGYIKSYRKHRNGKYRFEKTNNVNECLRFIYIGETTRATDKLNSLLDLIYYYKETYNFKNFELTDQEIRNSKLRILNVIKIKEGIFKNR